MDDHYITAGELALLVGIFVGPFLLAAGFTQFILLRQAGVEIRRVIAMLAAAALITLLLTWGLVYVVPVTTVGGAVFLLPAVIAATTVTSCVVLYAQRRGPAA